MAHTNESHKDESKGEKDGKRKEKDGYGTIEKGNRNWSIEVVGIGKGGGRRERRLIVYSAI